MAEFIEIWLKYILIILSIEQDFLKKAYVKQMPFLHICKMLN